MVPSRVRKRTTQWLSRALLLALLLAGCAAPLAGPDGTRTPPPQPPAPEGAISTDGVQVAPASHIQFQGSSSLPDGTPLQAQLYADDTPLSWWPEETLIEVQDGQWQVRVALGEGDAPQELSAEAQYVLRVWERGNPELEAPPFPFDLSGPATPKAGMVMGMAEVEGIDILIMESFPVQVAVMAYGTLRDACTEIDEVRQRFDADTDTFAVEIRTVRDPDQLCVQVLTPFEERITLDVYGLPAGTYTVDVNGVTDTYTLDVDNAPVDG